MEKVFTIWKADTLKNVKVGFVEEVDVVIEVLLTFEAGSSDQQILQDFSPLRMV
ncbi:hypothetical protein [Mesobacillus subterraneus]|uniref:hypothetical protein n=1 Tax=Mesobacillus subterraneus TaxID=285983 RepID=UPI001FE6B0C8|nr:hypothetical protein [Mesobacillus subterraneus]